MSLKAEHVFDDPRTVFDVGGAVAGGGVGQVDGHAIGGDQLAVEWLHREGE